MLIWAKGVQAAEIHTHLCAQYRDSTLSWRNVYKWIEMCKKVLKIVTDAECVGHLSTSARDEKLEEDILEDWRVTITEIEQELDPSQEPMHSVVYNSLAYGNICAE